MNIISATISLVLFAGVATARDFVVRTVAAKDTGTSHYSEEATITFGDAKLDLSRATLGSSPLQLKAYPLDATTCLFWGWSSTGGGMEDHHLYVVAARNGKVELVDQLELSSYRGPVFCGVRQMAAGNYAILFGGEGEVPAGETHLESAHKGETDLVSLSGEDSRALQDWKKETTWHTPYLPRVLQTLDWGIRIECNAQGLRLPEKRK